MRNPLETSARRGFDPVLAIILAVAVVLRVREALGTPLWYDELYTLAASQRPFAEMLANARADVHPPLHFVLTWAWSVFGTSDLAVRSLSIVCGIAGLAATYALAEAMFDRSAARISALLLALHPWHIYVSQEARSYALLWLALTLASLGAWRWCEKPARGNALLFVLAAATALWTHYIAGLVLAVQFVWGLAALPRDARRIGGWIGLHAAVGALFAAQLPTLWSQFHRVESDHWMPRPDLPALFDLARRVSFGGLLWVPLVLGLALLPFFLSRSRRAASFAWVVGPASVLVCWFLGTRGVRLFGVKYVLFSLPFLFTLVAAGVSRLPGRHAATIATALLAFIAVRSTLKHSPQPEAASLARARAYLQPRLRADDVVYHADTHTWLFGVHYFTAQRHRLLLGNQRLPYFEGGLIVPDSVRALPGEAIARDLAGDRWFAMAARPAGLDTRAAGAEFDSLANVPRSTLGVVTVWDGVSR